MNRSTKILAVLIIEDQESDAQLLVRLLKKADYELVYKQVETPSELRSALKKRTWDVIISDYKLPQFDGLAALKLIQEVGLDIPFIIVSGTIGEETAVSMLKAGAHDYLVKGDLARLVPAIERELEQAEIRQRHRQAEEALAASESELRALFTSMQDVVLVIDRDGVYRKIAPTNLALLAIPPAELLGKNLREVFPLGQAEEFISTIQLVLATKQTTRIEYEIHIDGQPMWFEASISPMDNDSTLWVAHDATDRKRIEETLRESEIRYQLVFENSGTANTIFDTECRAILQNSSSKYLTQPQDAIGKTALEIFGPKDGPIVTERMKRVLISGVSEVFETEFNMPVGRKWMRSSYQPLLNEKHVVIGVQVISQDITERKQAEEALRESQSLYQSLVEVSPLSICRKDLEGRFTFANKRFLEVSYITLTDLLGKTDFDLHPTELAEKFRHDEKVVLDTKQVWELIEERTLLNGETSIVQSIKVPTYDGKGKINGVQTSFWDITDHKRAEDQLRKLSRAVDQSPASIVITDLQGNIEYVNPKFSQVTGYSFGESLGKNPRILKSGKTAREEYKVMWDTILSGNIWQGELLNKKKNGETYWEFATITPVFGEDGKITNFLALKENITERKQAEEVIRTTNILLEQTLEQSPVPMVLVSMPDGMIRSANSACRSFLGVDDEPSPVGMKLSELNITWQDLDMQGNPGNYAELPLPRSLMGLKTDPQERWIVRKDGTSVYELAYGSPIFDAEGKVIAGYLVMIDITNRKQAEQDINQRVKELELLYQSGLALSQLLNPKEIGQKILELLKEKLGWHHTRIRLYHPHDDRLELLDFNQPGLHGDVERKEVVERLQALIISSDEGMSGWVIQHGQTVRSGDVSNDPRYVESYPGICSGLYVPMKLGERIVGMIGIESEEPDAFNEADERLVVTLANQAASAFENARLFGETHQRVMELETLNRISLVLRAVSKQEEMLSIVLDEALAILNTSHGSIELYNKTANTLEKTITRGWIAQVIDTSQKSSEGIAGKVFTSGELYISREFVSDPATRVAARSQMPAGWGGVCVPIRTTQQTLGILLVSIPSERELNGDEIRLLATLSEMTGAALQRMQLHEQTVRRLEQLHALRAIDQAIASNLDMRLTLNILLDQTISQLGVDAADVLLLPAGSSMLELAASRGFHSHLLGSTSLGDSFALHAIMEHRIISALDSEIAAQHESPHFGKLWKVEGFACYWCVPLIIKGEVKGVLEVYCRKAFTPDPEWLEFLESLAGQAAITIDTSLLFENLQRANLDLSLAYDATIEGWSRAMDLRDHETEGHTLRVTDLTMKLARAMRISESQLTAIRRGALLHDIGKMGVPDSILLKEGNLTGEEWALMRRHPQLAHDMLAPISYLNDAIDIPYCHHEKWDGTGYPQGLKGERIPLIARIFAVVDVWDALTNDRTYRRKWSKEETLEYIKDQSGMHFDPQVVDVFLKHIEADS